MTSEQWILKPFDPAQVSDAEWEPIIDVHQGLIKENNPHDPVPPRESSRKGLTQLANHPIMDVRMNFLYHKADNRIAGFLLLGYQKPESPEYESSKHVAFSDGYVVPEFRRQGLGTMILEMACEQCAEHGVTLLQVGADTPHGNAFCEHFDFQVAGRARENRLTLADVDWAMVETWNSDGVDKSPDTEIITFDGLYDDDLEAYADIYTEVFNQMPQDDMEAANQTYTPERMRQMAEMHVERGRIWMTKITREPNGDISGLTEIIYDPDRPNRISQILTGVREEHRGRGLGKWLKANMLLQIREQYPDVEYVSTGNADSNAPMLSINDRLGFKVHKDHTMYKAQISDLQSRLS